MCIRDSLWTDVALETPENILGIAEAEGPAGFSISIVPNPGIQSQLVFAHGVQESGVVRILDLTGRCVRELAVPAGTTQLALPTGLPAGPYLIRHVQSGSGTASYWLNRN